MFASLIRELNDRLSKEVISLLDISMRPNDDSSNEQNAFVELGDEPSYGYESPLDLPCVGARVEILSMSGSSMTTDPLIYIR